MHVTFLIKIKACFANDDSQGASAEQLVGWQFATRAEWEPRLAEPLCINQAGAGKLPIHQIANYSQLDMPKPQKKKSSLKASLQAHQARQQLAQRQADGQKKAYVRKNTSGPVKQKKSKEATVGDGKGKGKGTPTIPFDRNDKLLLIGEGV
jgi:hypothetical protein